MQDPAMRGSPVLQNPGCCDFWLLKERMEEEGGDEGDMQLEGGHGLARLTLWHPKEK